MIQASKAVAQQVMCAVSSHVLGRVQVWMAWETLLLPRVVMALGRVALQTQIRARKT